MVFTEPLTVKAIGKQQLPCTQRRHRYGGINGVQHARKALLRKLPAPGGQRFGSVMSVIDDIQPVCAPSEPINGDMYMRASKTLPSLRRTRISYPPRGILLPSVSRSICVLRAWSSGCQS